VGFTASQRTGYYSQDNSTSTTRTLFAPQWAAIHKKCTSNADA